MKNNRLSQSLARALIAVSIVTIAGVIMFKPGPVSAAKIVTCQNLRTGAVHSNRNTAYRWASQALRQKILQYRKGGYKVVRRDKLRCRPGSRWACTATVRICRLR